MFVDKLEASFQQMGLPPDQPTLLLAIPLVACLSVDRKMSRGEAEEVATFMREKLDFDSGEMRVVHKWLNSPPSAIMVERSLSLIENLVFARDVPTMESRTISMVFMECERMLRRRESEHALGSPQGRQMLWRSCQRLNIDLGKSWEEVAPETFDEEVQGHEASSRPRKAPAVRRWRAARRQEDDSSIESGGLT